MYKSIRPGQVWLDTDGNRIQAHAGSILHEDGVFYWYGENKEKTTPGNGVWHWGVRCYSSTDLYNWTNRGLIIPPVLDDPSSPLHPASLMDRPHILRNPQGDYVCWLKIMGDGATGHSTILTADNILGPYRMHTKKLRPFGMNGGDFDFAVDSVERKAYMYYERPHTELICADLTGDYTGVSGYYSTHLHRAAPPDVREAPAYFRRRGLHYLLTSGTTAYFPNPTETAVAPSYHGPWTVQGITHVGDDSRTSFRSQISSVFRHPTKRDLYIALADRWLPNLSEKDSNAEDRFRVLFSPDRDTDIEVDAEGDLDETDTSVADYVWLPLRFAEGRAFIDWHDEWCIDDFEDAAGAT